jgi:hypothetical protein
MLMSTMDAMLQKNPNDPDALNEACWMGATTNEQLDAALADCSAALRCSSSRTIRGFSIRARSPICARATTHKRSPTPPPLWRKIRNWRAHFMCVGWPSSNRATLPAGIPTSLPARRWMLR